MDTWRTVFYTLSLHDALPICRRRVGTHRSRNGTRGPQVLVQSRQCRRRDPAVLARREDRKSTRLNSSHVATSYAVFCLKKKTSAVKCSTAGAGADSARLY